jgi:hypothetical protein
LPWFAGKSLPQRVQPVEGGERNACYGELRNELVKPPAKGGEMPTG